MQSAALISSYRRERNLSHGRAIERVISTIYERLGEDLSLQEMANIAMMSLYHFNRVFRQVAGIPPVQFLGAVRLDAAKRLLLTTPAKVIDICFEVGYNSLGTFTRRFTELVGVSPCRLRQLAEIFPLSSVQEFCDCLYHPTLLRPVLNSGISGYVHAPNHFKGTIFVGLFPAHIPQGRPVGCALLTGPGAYRIAPLPDGRYFAFAVAFDGAADPLTYLLYEDALRGTSGPLPIVVRNGQSSAPADIALQPARLTDPPILIALPFLLMERLTQASKVAM